MGSRRSSADGSLLAAAMVCSATVSGQLVAGRALRDTLLLTSLGAAAIPPMLVATSAVSLLLVRMHERRLRTVAHAALVPAYFALSSALFLAEWALRAHAPIASSVVLYLHVSAVGPLLAASFGTMAAERFDARSITRRITASGTVGGLVAALTAERIAAWFGAPSLLPVLALFQAVSAGLLRGMALRAPAGCGPDDTEVRAHDFRSHHETLRSVVRVPWVRQLASVAFLGAAAPALVEYLFKAQALDTFGRGDQLLRFFALYYAGTGLATVLLHTFSSRVLVDRFGVRVAATGPSAALIVAGSTAMVVPGLGTLAAACAGASALRGSWLREALERLFAGRTPARIHAARMVVDVVADRAGAASAGVLLLAAAGAGGRLAPSAILAAAMLCSAGVIAVAARMRCPELELPPLDGPASDPETCDIVALRSGDRASIARVLARADLVSRALVPHVASTLADDRSAGAAITALRRVAAAHVGQFVDVLLDPHEEVTVRRRIAAVLAGSSSQRAADGLALALHDLRFAVRSAATRSLMAIRHAHPSVRIDRHHVLDVILNEVTVGRCVWDGRTIPQDECADQASIEHALRIKAGDSVAHVFTLLSLIHPRETVQTALAGLLSGDGRLRAAALDYLHCAVPEAVRLRLWPLLGEPAAREAVLTRTEAVDVLGVARLSARPLAGESAEAT